MRKLLIALPLFVFLALATLVTAPGVSRADEPRLIGQYSDWAAYVFTEDGKKVCYMASQPKKSEGNYSRRGDVFALVTHRPAEGTKNVFSYITGYGYKPGSDATLKISGKSYTLFTQDETAWAPDADTDGKIAQSIRTGSDMSVAGTSARGTLTKDVFSLKGSGAAHDAINQECGVSAN